jgi:thioredoxin reductase
LTDATQRTNIEGIFTVGDITYIGLRLITVPAAHEAIASHHIYSYLKKPTGQEKLGPSRFNANIRRRGLYKI